MCDRVHCMVGQHCAHHTKQDNSKSEALAEHSQMSQQGEVKTANMDKGKPLGSGLLLMLGGCG